MSEIVPVLTSCDPKFSDEKKYLLKRNMCHKLKSWSKAKKTFFCAVVDFFVIFDNQQAALRPR